MPKQTKRPSPPPLVMSPYVAALLAMMNIAGGVIGNKNHVNYVAKKAKR